MNRKEDERPRHLKLASWSLGLGVVGLLTLLYLPGYWSPLALLAAVVCGHVAQFRIRRSSGRWSGMKTALFGCLIGYGTVLGLFMASAPSCRVLEGRSTNMMNNGRNLYVSLFVRGLENPLDPTSAWPQTNEADGRVFANSTEFFRWVVTSGVMVVNADFSFFAGPNIPMVKSTKAAAFKAKNNGWCVVSGVNGKTPDGMPVLFTRDLAVTNLIELVGPIRKTVAKGGPFEGKAVGVVENGGNAYVLTQRRFDERWEDVLNNYDAWYGDHPVLRP